MLECKADKMREKIAMLGWLTPLYLVCDLCESALSNQTVTL